MNLFKLWGEIGVKNQGAIQAIDETTGAAQGAESTLSSAFAKIGSAVAGAFAVDKIISFGKEIVNTAATVDAEASAFNQIMGDYSSQASEKLTGVADATGVMATRMQSHFTSLSAKFKGLGFDVEEATDYAARGLTLASDAAAFWDTSLDDATSHLNSFINGSYEGGEAIGLFANDTQMAMYAVEQGIVESTSAWSSLDEATKQATRLEYAENMYAQSGATGQAAREAEQYANVQANLNEKWRQFKAQIGAPILQNIVIPAMQTLSTLVDTASTAFQTLSAWVQTNYNTLSNLATIVGIAAAAFVGLKAGMAIQGVVQGFQTAQVAISLLSMEIGSANLAQAALNGTMTVGQTIVALLTGKMTLAALAQGAMTKAQAALNAVMAANPIGLIITIIVALVAAFVILWNKSEAFRNFWKGLWEGIKSVVSAVVDWIKQAWTDVGNFFTVTVPGWFDSFKNFFVNIWNSVTEFLSGVWETIKNVVQVGLMLIVSLITGWFELITLPFRLIWENCKETVTTVWNAIVEFLTGIWESIKEAVTTAFNAVKDVVTNVFTAISDFITTIWNAIVAFFTPIFETIKNIFTTALNAIKTVVTNVFNAIKTVITNVFNAIKSVASSIWSGIKSVITTAVNAIKTTVSNVFNAIKTTVSNIFNGIKSVATSVWNGVKTAIETPINKARDTVKAALDKIKSFFDNLKLKFPDIKLPHFSITGKFSLDPPSVPKLSISWYAKGGILNAPTLFDYNPATGNAKVGGEAGAEAIAPIDTLLGYVRTAVQEENSGSSYQLEKLTSMLAEYMPKIINGTNRQVVLDTGVLVGEIAPQMDSKLGDINELRKRGR